MSLSLILQTLFIGISSGMVSYLVVAGISLVISGMGMINFGQGAYYVLGAYICFTFTSFLGFGWGLLLAVIVTAVLGFLIEIPLRPLFGKDMIYILMFTMALAYIVCDIMVAVWGYQMVSTSLPEILTGTLEVFGFSFPIYYMFMIVLSAIVAIAFFIMFYKTKLGMYFRAIISDKLMVASLGINVTMLCSLMFSIAIMLGGIAGALNSPISGLSPKEGLTVFGNIMPILMIGGMKNIKAALPAALLVGIVNAFGAIFVPSIYALLPFMLMIIVMFFKPQGLFTAKE